MVYSVCVYQNSRVAMYHILYTSLIKHHIHNKLTYLFLFLVRIEIELYIYLLLLVDQSWVYHLQFSTNIRIYSLMHLYNSRIDGTHTTSIPIDNNWLLVRSACMIWFKDTVSNAYITTQLTTLPLPTASKQIILYIIAYALL